MKILIMGLPGTGKTTLARYICDNIESAVNIDGDVARSTISRDLSFSPSDRMENAIRIGNFCDALVSSKCIAVASFICPTPLARQAFQKWHRADIIIWMNNVPCREWKDTTKIFVPPENSDFIFNTFDTKAKKVNRLEMDHALRQIDNLIHDIENNHE